MKYTKFQRYLSFITLFFFLFSTTIHFPLPDVNVFADEGGNNNIVSIIVEEETYKEIAGGVGAYAQNISEALGNTQVVIFPTPYGTPAYEIASLNESLYNQGLEVFDKSKSGKLVGTVLIGKLDIPIVYEGNDSQKSIVPYIDFADKFFTYDHQTKKYVKNEYNKNGLSAEIWHGVINPNVGSNPLDDVELLNEYFKKNNDFYQGSGEFSNDKILLNGKQYDELDEKYEPYVFYFDQLREFQAASLENYNAYNTFLNYKEDIVYQRYTKKLAEIIQTEVLGSHQESVEDLADIFGDEFSGDKLLESAQLDGAVPDIQTRHIINKTTKKFVEIFSKGSIGELRKDVYNAGRYNYDGNDVNVDFIPYLITLLDSVNDEIVKEAIVDMENKIDEKVETQLQKDIYIPYKIEEEKSRYSKDYTDVYVNLLYGKSPENMSDVSQCSPYYGQSGSGQLVFANRGLNTENIDIDTDFLTKLDKSLDTTRCMANIENGLTTNSIYGGNTPINIDPENTTENGLTLGSHNKNNSLVPISDIKGSSVTTAGFDAPSYTQCLQSNFYAYTLHEVDDRFSSPDVYYQLPALGKLPSKGQYDCRVLPRKISDSQSYESLSARGLCSGTICSDGNKKYFFKKLSSVYQHKQPTLETIKNQIAYGLTPSLPVDSVRYVDFQNKSGDYQKIEYPALYDFPFEDDEEENSQYSLKQVDEALQQYFGDKVTDFADIDFYQYLLDKPEKTLIVGEDQRVLKYYDSLVFAVYWSNLNSASAKYQFILENYLGDEFQAQDEDGEQETYFHLPKSKKQYEIAYLGAPGDGEKMHIQLNPEAKGENPYADIIQKNAALQSQLLGKNIGGTQEKQYDNNFKCAPPEGVPIFEWLPAVVCWIDDMLPPSISVSDSTCGTTIPLLTQQQQEYIAQCSRDEDKNGVNDCLEQSLQGGTVELSSEASSYYINQPAKLNVELLDNNNNTIVYNNASEVSFKLVKVEVPRDQNGDFTGDNVETIYSGGEIDAEVRKYISFTPTTQRVNKGKTQSSFATTGNEANLYFQAEVVLKNDFNAQVVKKNSEIIKVEVRADKIFTHFSTLQKDQQGNISYSGDSQDEIVSENSQIFVIDEQRVDKNNLKNIIYSENSNTQKTVLSLNQKNKFGVARDIAYPLHIYAKNTSGEELFDKEINYNDLSRFASLPGITQAGNVVFEIVDNNGQKIETQLFFAPEKANKIETKIGSNILEANGAVTTNVITVVDKFGNPLVGERLTIESSLSGNSLAFAANNGEKISTNIVEGYQLLRLESLNKTGVGNLTIVVKDENNQKLLETTQQIRVVDTIDVNISQTQLKVGGDAYTIDLQVGNSQAFENFNSRVYFNISDVYATVEKPYFDVVNGKAQIKLFTSNIASKSVPVEIQIEGLKTIYTKEVEILHETPAYLQLGASGDGIQANGEATEIKAFIKDEYGNIAYSLNSGTVAMEVAKDFQKFLSPADGEIKEGIATLKPETSTTPGVAYYKVSYAGMQAAGMMQTYFHWDGDSISNGEYNALYTTLLGAAYGDVTQQNYLAKSLLFNQDNRALAVTSLLNSPYKFSDIASVEYAGAIRNISNADDLSTDIVFSSEVEDNKFVVKVRNVAMGDYVASITPKFSQPANLVLCNASNGDFSTCLDEDETSILVQSQSEDYSVFKDSDSLFLENKYGEKVFQVDELGNIEKSAGIYFQILDKGQKYLQVNISSSQEVIGSFVYNFTSSQVVTTRLYESKIENPNNTIEIALADELYAARNEYGEGNYNKVIYYNDPFDSNYSTNNMGDGSNLGFENFGETKGIGWSGANKTLLSFAAGESVGASLQPYQSLGVVNLGDPVLKLKKIQRELPKANGELRNYDSTIGKLISDQPDIKNYQLFDYNNDNKTDVLLVSGNKYFEILENIGNTQNVTFSRGKVGNIFDLGNPDFVLAGDFGGDGFGDIFFINDQGEPFLLSNNNGDFVRGSLLLQFGKLDGAQDVKIMDMDDDGIDDIIVLDKNGNISIYYGGPKKVKELFRFNKNSKLTLTDENLEIKIGVVENKLVLTPKFKDVEYDVGNIFPISSGNLKFQVCNNLVNCDFTSSKNFALKQTSQEFNIQNNGDSLEIQYQGEDIFSVDSQSNFEKTFNTTFKIVEESRTKGLEFEIYFKDIYVTNAVFYFDTIEVKHDKIYEFQQSDFNGNYFIIDGDENFTISKNQILDWIISYDDKLPVFDKKSIGQVELPDITNGTRSDNGALYFPGLVGPEETGDMTDFISESEEFMDAIKQNVDELHEKQGEKLNTSGLTNMIYTPVAYQTGAGNGGQQGIIDSVFDNPGIDTNNAQGSLEQLIGERDVYLSYPETTKQSTTTNFIRSEYAHGVGVDIVKNYNGSIYNDSMGFNVSITNDSGKTLSSIAYVESILNPFILDVSSVKVSNPEAIISFDTPGYDFMISGVDIQDGETLSITASLKVPEINIGTLEVGYFESDVEGVTDDNFGDIIYKPSNQSCSQAVKAFYSCETKSKGLITRFDCPEFGEDRYYSQAQDKMPSCDAEKIQLPEEVDGVNDSDGNGVPDYLDKFSQGNPNALEDYADEALKNIQKDSDNDGVPDYEDDTNSDTSLLSNLDEINENIDYVITGVDNIIQGLSCGFGGGGCIATPLNWAPLAPGGDPTLFGAPIGDGLKVDEGLPVFSALTWMQYGPICGPAVWPISPLKEGCSGTGAGGELGIDSPSNFFRLFVTPTLTGGMGVAACFGGPARVAGYSNMPGLHPLMPGGNCIVTATPLASCSSDGSNGDPSSVGFSQGNTNGTQLFNANCSSDSNQILELDKELIEEYIKYQKTGEKTPKFEELFKKSFTQLSKPNSVSSSSAFNKPLIEIGGQSLDDQLEVNVDFSSIKSGNFEDVIQVKNRRISAFPDFLMGWVTRQIEEIVTKLTDFPTVFIILPDFSGVLDFGNAKSDDLDDVIKADKNLSKFVGEENLNSANSGIKEAYTFLANIPLVKLEQENIAIDVPWISGTELEATKEKWSATVDQRKEELQRAKQAWSFGAACNQSDEKEKQKCEEQNDIANNYVVRVEGLISSLEQNLEVIESYKRLPKDLGNLVRKKEDYLEQILCNVEAISEILGGWIGRNGERFKAWVELYILIKAILKSWQLLIDVFVDYEAQCHECKNERGDLMTFIWKMISAVIPDIPVIQFPKWPDIILDLHNIRAGLTISLPEFSFGTRPMVLPNLPKLYLPDTPNLAINLPELPVLPQITIPELPDLPGLPTVELPNLPPPPTLPKMFAQLEGILEILKAITKAMCILKTSPFVPEWRAGDQIAFLTERQGYLPTDFLDISLPQFSFPFVDAIEVTSYVNLEFETDFVTQLARQVTMPLTTFSNDFTQILNLGMSDLDFRNIPSQIEINVGGEGVEGQIGLDTNKVFAFVVYVTGGISQGVNYLDTNKDVTVTNAEFKQLVAQGLAGDVFTSHPRYSEFRNLWDEVFEYNFESENAFIAELQKNNSEKFDTLENILHTEILKNKEFMENLDEYLQPKFIQNVDMQLNSNVDAYNQQLDKFNQKFYDSVVQITDNKPEQNIIELKKAGENLTEKISTPLQAYSQYITQTPTFANQASSGDSGEFTNQCYQQTQSEYRYEYKGLYAVEAAGDKTYSYNLFDYKDELDGNEILKTSDLDNDGDQDYVVMYNGQIYMKQNLSTQQKTKSDFKVLTFSSKQNVFYNSDTFYGVVENFAEGSIDSNKINAKFSASTQNDIFNYRMTLNNKINRSDGKNSIVDAFSSIDEQLQIAENELFTSYKNLAVIKNLGHLKYIELTTKELKNIREDIQNDIIVSLSRGTKIYAGDTTTRIGYVTQENNEIQYMLISKYSHIELKQSIKVVEITQNAYIQGRYDITLKGEEIRSYKGLPIFDGAHMQYVGNHIVPPRGNTYIDIEYFDTTQALVNFNFVDQYWLYDLGITSDNFAITLSTKNDFKYGYIQSFNEGIFSIKSNQIVLSPQIQADSYAPVFYLSELKIPVYQSRIIDLTDLVYEDSGLAGIKKIVVNMNPDDPDNPEFIPDYKIIHTSESLKIVFGPYDELFSRDISFEFSDVNGNISNYSIPFEVYAPNPEIQNVDNNNIYGNIDEDLSQQPVSFYRYRAGEVTKLESISGQDFAWTDVGEYNMELSDGQSGLEVLYGDTLIAFVNEITGGIELKDYASKIEVVSSNNSRNDNYYPKIEIIKNNQILYYQYLKMKNADIDIVQNFDEIKDGNIAIKMLQSANYSYEQIPNTLDYNPGSVIMYDVGDAQKNPLFVIFPDGRIQTINNNYILEYDMYKDFIKLRLVNKNTNTNIAEIVYALNGGYIIE